ncbi:MAG: ATP-binding protein [Gemmatimonadota bacterium]
MRFTIRTKLFVAILMVSLSFVALSLAVMDRFVRRVADTEVAGALTRGARAYERYSALQSDLLSSRARSTAQAPVLRAVVSIPGVDHGTVQFTAGELHRAVGSALMVVADARGRLLAEVGDSTRWGDDLSGLPGVPEALQGEEYAGIWDYQGKLYRVSVSPVVVGDGIPALLALGERWDQAAAAIGQFTGQGVLILQAGRLVAQSREGSGAPAVLDGELVGHPEARPSAAPSAPFHITLGGREALAVAVPEGGGAAHVVLFRDLTDLEMDVRRYERYLVAAAAVSAVLAVVVSLWLSARVSRPIRELTEAAEQLGAGRLARPAAVRGSDELGRLAQSFNGMVAQIQERTDALQSEVAERLQAEENMRRSERYFRSLIENASDLVLVVNRQGRIQYLSPSCEAILGYGSELVRESSYFDIVHPDDAEGVRAVHRQVAESPAGPVSHEFRVQPKAGSWRIVRGVFNNQLADAAVAGIVVNLQDITERMQAEMRLAQARKLEAIGQLAAGVAHEINSPMQFIGDNTHFLGEAFEDILRVLAGCQRLLQEERDGADAGALAARAAAVFEGVDLGFLRERIPQALQRSREGVVRVTQLVNAMREFSHPGSTERTYVDLNRTIESAVTVSRNEWKYVADLDLEPDPELPAVLCLPGEISQVIVNLVVNAAHAIGDVVGDGAQGKGRITVTTRGRGAWAEVLVRDTGCGIPLAIQPRVFDPFFTTKEVGRGTGQGLAISHDIVVVKHGGELFFESEPGQGTTFVVRLPIDGKAERPPEASA